MRTLKSLSLMMLLTLTCVTTEASTATETAYTTQVKTRSTPRKNRTKGHISQEDHHQPAEWRRGSLQPQTLPLLSRILLLPAERQVREGETIHTNAGAESFNAKVKAFRSQFRGVTDIPFFCSDWLNCARYTGTGEMNATGFSD